MMTIAREFADFKLASSVEVVQTLGKRLRDQRMSKLMTQEELAERAGVALGAVKKLESTGKVTVQTLVHIARALGLIGELADIFSMRPRASIADMERNELTRRKRARKSAAATS